MTTLTLPAGKFYVAPIGTTPAENAAYYLGKTDGADLDVQPKTDERWGAGTSGIYLDDVFPIGSDTVVTVSCLESIDAVLTYGLMADVATVDGAARFTPRSALATGGKFCIWHWPAPLAGTARRLWIRKALVLPNGPVRLKRGRGADILQIVPLRFRVLNPGGGAVPWQIDHLPALDQ